MSAKFVETIDTIVKYRRKVQNNKIWYVQFLTMLMPNIRVESKRFYALTLINLTCPRVQFLAISRCAFLSFFALSLDNFSTEIYPQLLQFTM